MPQSFIRVPRISIIYIELLRYVTFVVVNLVLKMFLDIKISDFLYDFSRQYWRSAIFDRKSCQFPLIFIDKVWIIHFEDLNGCVRMVIQYRKIEVSWSHHFYAKVRSVGSSIDTFFPELLELQRQTHGSYFHEECH